MWNKIRFLISTQHFVSGIVPALVLPRVSCVSTIREIEDVSGPTARPRSAQDCCLLCDSSGVEATDQSYIQF